jgi:excinuclease UvrABC helicase subunit UvrB
MSQCYDFQKCIIISLASVAISLTIGLVLMEYGYGENATSNTSGKAMAEADKLIQETQKPEYGAQKQREALINYCYQHADRPNPIQDLIDKGFLPEGFKETCKSVKQTYDKVQTKLEAEEQARLKELQVRLKEQQENTAKFNKCWRDAITIQNITLDDCSRLYRK